MASHTLDLLDYFLGPIQTASGYAGNQAGRYTAEDTVAASYAFESGVHDVGTWCFETGIEEDRNEIIGTRGKITYATFKNKPIRLTTSQGTEERMIEPPMHAEQPMIQSIVDELLGVGGPCPSSGRSAARTNRVMDALLASYY